MMMLKNLPENFPLAKTALAHWDHEEAGLDQLLGKFRTSSNAVYPFRQKGQLCFLRLAPTEEKLKTNLLGELEFLEYLKSYHYPALLKNLSITSHTLQNLSVSIIITVSLYLGNLGVRGNICFSMMSFSLSFNSKFLFALYNAV